ncbi:MAG TPA: aldo/keto reductase [Gemmatales bacterium]|nr:aldo/keto reductase [Gemmatales bacterium]HMP16723.1 aldo/keto reductase [Gemmatales bacterium]
MNHGSYFGILGAVEVPLVFGLLRLCTEGRPDRDIAIKLIHHALDSGIRLLDTADAYCVDHKDFHYGELLAVEALRSWDGPRDDVRILTKVGMVRPKGRWLPNGKPEFIKQNIEHKLEVLQQERLFLVQLHVHDPKVPFEETLACLSELQQTGKMVHVGLCNTNILEIEQAQRHFPVAAIQNELSLQVRKNAQNGLLEYSAFQGIPFLAYRPLGGNDRAGKLSNNKTLSPSVNRYKVSAQQLALATLRHARNNILPLFGATQPASITASVHAAQIQLDSDTLEVLNKKFSFASKKSMFETMATVKDLMLGDGEIVLLMGIQGAGKSERVKQYVDEGYVRLNRDLLGGKLDDLIPRMQSLIESGKGHIVLDNTYPTRISRAPVLQTARRYGLPVKCQHLDTPIQEARINVVLRMLAKYGKLLGPDEMKAFSKSDPNLLPPSALKKWQDSFEAPQMDEGFSSIAIIPFLRRRNPAYTQKALLLDVDGTLRITKSGELYPRDPDDQEILPNRSAVLQRYKDDGYLIFFVSNQSGIASGQVSQASVESAFQKTAELLDVSITEICYCPHPAFPVNCYCRKPLPGMGVYLLEKYELAWDELIVVGDMKSDQEFAEQLNLQYIPAETFFNPE